MTNTPAINPQFGRSRRGLIRVLVGLFVLGLCAMLLLGTILVLLQLGGLIFGNADFIIAVSQTFGPPTYAVAASFGILTLLVSLAYGWKSND